MGWPITPDAFVGYLQHIAETYRPERILVTENGASYSDEPGPDGTVDDSRRSSYLEQHISAVDTAVDSGVPIEGYFVWSLLDNLEWVSGYSQRFGLVWVEHSTGRRVPKGSYYWYRDLIANRRRAAAKL
jgi:beta-glucosidase